MTMMTTMMTMAMREGSTRTTLRYTE